MKKGRLPSANLSRVLLLLIFGSVSCYSACGFGFTINETNGFDFPDSSGPLRVYALELGSNTFSGHVTTTSNTSDIDILAFTVVPESEYRISSLTLTGATLPTDATDPVFYICQLTVGTGCGGPVPVTPSTTLPLAFPATDINGVGIFGDAGSFANCGTTSGCGYTIEIQVSAPIPAAVLLFGCGLLGLVGIARRRKSTWVRKHFGHKLASLKCLLSETVIQPPAQQ